MIGALAKNAASMVGRRSNHINNIISRSMAISVGSQLPSVEVHKNFPPEKINIADYCKDKNVVIVGLPGAFTPTWCTKQIPAYMEKQDALRDLGVQEVIILAVNDGAVMMEWGKKQKAGLSMLTFLGDPNSRLTRALDLELTAPGPIEVLGPGRCKRFAIHAINGEIKAVNVSESPDDPTGDSEPSASFPDGIMATMK